MVAHSDVEAGEIVLEEAAAVQGPSNKSGKKADVCLECQGGMNDEDDADSKKNYQKVTF